MIESALVEYQMQWEQRCRKAVVYPAAERRGNLQRDLAGLLQERATAAPGPAAVRRLRHWLVRGGRGRADGAVAMGNSRLG